MNKKYITLESIRIAFPCFCGRKGEDTMRELYDIYRIAAQDTSKERVESSTFTRAYELYKEYRKLNRQNDTLLVLDNDFERYQSSYTKALHQRNEKQEKKVRELAKNMGFKLVYYSHIATLQNIKTKMDLCLNKVL